MKLFVAIRCLHLLLRVVVLSNVVLFVVDESPIGSTIYGWLRGTAVDTAIDFWLISSVLGLPVILLIELSLATYAGKRRALAAAPVSDRQLWLDALLSIGWPIFFFVSIWMKGPVWL